MERIVPFFVGFIIAGLIGFLTSLIFGTLATSSKKGKKHQWSNETLFGVIGLRVMWQMLLLVFLLVSICTITMALQNEWLLVLIVGFFFAAVIGFTLQNLRKNWKYIVSIFRHTTQTSSTNEISTKLEDVIARDTSLNNSSSSESGSSSKASVSQITIKHLEKQLADLLAEHDAVINQLSFSLSEVDRVRLKRQRDTVEREIDEVQNKLDSLK